ncbi:hypothetical protein L2E82_49727 [Cichorium intybus]|uniref:Uncharacterized protein n=1 Tax=Cichorium intybus TaxID=13427 RepID=A0ACB8Z2C0_CICIN|nr:hypothetical protein L2E82_49727 [Cichorium intybus]
MRFRCRLCHGNRNWDSGLVQARHLNIASLQYSDRIWKKINVWELWAKNHMNSVFKANQLQNHSTSRLLRNLPISAMTSSNQHPTVKGFLEVAV